ncbi:MAG: DUF3299 domain-containing protein [Pirellulales bacterium]|nr:DUF3299 domain-containing protein [Planctomycetales bacterium]
MSTMTDQDLRSSYQDDDVVVEDYRAISSLAIVALVLSLLSGVVLLNVATLPISIAAVALSILAVWRIRRRSDELIGLGVAKAALVISSLLLVCGVSWASFVYATEVPEGFERLSFRQLQPPRDAPPGQLLPADVKDWDGTDVFIKGYIHPSTPGGSRSGIQKFILVPDQGTCCFGGQPKLTDMIQVSLLDGETTDYSMWSRGVWGRFHVRPGVGVEDLGTVVYHLDAVGIE